VPRLTPGPSLSGANRRAARMRISERDAPVQHVAARHPARGLTRCVPGPAWSVAVEANIAEGGDRWRPTAPWRLRTSAAEGAPQSTDVLFGALPACQSSRLLRPNRHVSRRADRRALQRCFRNVDAARTVAFNRLAHGTAEAPATPTADSRA
jgi:hypothetical protein